MSRDPSANPTPLDRASFYIESLKYRPGPGTVEPVNKSEVVAELEVLLRDANIRQALIDRYGPGKDRAIGRKLSPGPLYGLSGDCWSALAVAVTTTETVLVPQEVVA